MTTTDQQKECYLCATGICSDHQPRLSDQELLDLSMQTMKYIYGINKGRFIEHEQAAYNCIWLLRDRLSLYIKEQEEQLVIIKQIHQDLKDK